MTDFRISITADPGPAVRAADVVERELNGLEAEAAALRAALIDALSVRDQGTANALGRIENILQETADQALITDARISQMGKDVNARGLRRFNDELDESKKKAIDLRAAFGGLFAGITAGLVVREYARLSDELTNAQNRIRAVTDSEEELVSVTAQLQQVANDTRSAFEGTAAVFTRLATSREQLGRSNEQLIQFTESLNQAIILSGASAQEAQNGLIQLSQGLASGALRGDELRSVLEQLPAVADVIAEGLGVTRGELRNLGEQGAITAEVILDAFEGARGELADRFANTIPTIGQALTVLRNEAVELVGGFNETTGASELLSRAILLLSDNLGAVSIVAATFGTLLSFGLAAQAIPTAIAALGKLRVAVAAAGGPFVALGAAALAATVYVADLIDEQNAAITAANKSLEADSAFGSIGAQIRLARRELQQLEAAQERQGFLSETQAARVAELNARIDDYTNKSKEALQVGREQAAQTARNNAATVDLLASLEREAELLRLSSVEQEVQKALIEATTDLKEKGVDLTDKNNAALAAEIEAAIRRNQQLGLQGEILGKIRGPQETYQRQLDALRQLLIEGAINQDEFNRAVQEFRPPEASDDLGTFEGQLRALREQNEELEIKANNGAIQREGLLIELGLRREGVTLSREQQDELGRELLRRYELNEALADQKKKQDEAAEAAKKAEAAREADQKALDQLKNRIDLTTQLFDEEQRLRQLRQQEPSLAEEIDAAYRDLRLRQLEAATDLASGFERAFLKIQIEAENLAAVGEQVVNVFADEATAAIQEFAKTGEFDFKKFANSVLDEIQKIIIRLLVVQAINAVAGAAGLNVNLGGTGVNPGRAGGGTAQPGQAPFPVGEEGPEMFYPNRTGTIAPNPASVQQAPPQVNLQVTNVMDPNLVPQAIASGVATEPILNLLSENREFLKQLTRE